MLYLSWQYLELISFNIFYQISVDWSSPSSVTILTHWSLVERGCEMTPLPMFELNTLQYHPAEQRFEAVPLAL